MFGASLVEGVGLLIELVSKIVFAKTGSVFELRFSVFYFLKTGFIRFSVFSKMLQLPHPSMNFEEFFCHIVLHNDPECFRVLQSTPICSKFHQDALHTGVLYSAPLEP